MLKFVKFGILAAGLVALSACEPGYQFKSIDQMNTGTASVSTGSTSVVLPGSTSVSLPQGYTTVAPSNVTFAQPTVVSQPTTTFVSATPVTTVSSDFTIRGTSFAVNSDRLLSSGRSQLNSVAETMLSQGGTYNVTGFASTEGDAGYNQSLSERRARSVAAYLVGKGVSSSSLISSGAGETTQFGSDLASNRRVQISPSGSGFSSTSGYEVISSTPIYETAVGSTQVIQQPIVISQ